MKFFSFVVAGLLSACTQSPMVQTEPPPEDLAKDSEYLNALIPELMQEGEIPGLQLALIQDGSVAFEQGFGVKDTTKRGRVTSNTVFEAASLTKPLFAYAVLKLVDIGLLELDVPLVTYVPEPKLEGALGHSVNALDFRSEWFIGITARHVLSHSSGMPHGDGGEVTTIAFEPGTDWKYSAEGYSLLQLVVEHLTGKRLDVIIDELVINPLGMSRSSMVWEDKMEPRMTAGHSVYGAPADFRKRTNPTAAASLYTTAGDYARFVSAVMNGKGLSPRLRQEMFEWLVDMNDEGSIGWGIGFGLQKDGDSVSFWQWGDYSIFRSLVVASIEDGKGIVYLTNSFNGLSICDALTRAVIEKSALGCLALRYQPYDSDFYSLFWTARDGSLDDLEEKLTIASEADPVFFTPEQIAGMAKVLDNEGMFEESAVFHNHNIRANPGSGRYLFNLARSRMLAGDFERAGELLRASASAPHDPSDTPTVAWITGYMKAIRDPLAIDDTILKTYEGDYGPRHLRARDGELYYSRDTTDIAAQVKLFAETEDTFVLEGNTHFKLQVLFDDAGYPVALVGLYDSGRRDRAPKKR